ncbi:MAG: DUF6599 family protein [bacterium]
MKADLITLRTESSAVATIIGCGWLLLILLMSCTDNKEHATTSQSLVLPTSLGEWTAVEPVETYDRNSIFDYIDGAGEVYNAYDFRRLAVQKYRDSVGDEITLEVFDMGNAGDAYGVFTFANEDQDSTIGQGCEMIGSTLCFWQGRYYICLGAAEESAAAIEGMRVLAQAVAKQIPPAVGRPDWIEHLPGDIVADGTIRFFHHHTLLNYHHYLSEHNWLNLDTGTDAALIENGLDAATMLVVKYATEAKSATALATLKRELLGGQSEARTESGRWTAVGAAGEYLAAVFGAPKEMPATETVARLLDAVALRKTGSE